jgi:hypothetical protein
MKLKARFGDLVGIFNAKDVYSQGMTFISANAIGKCNHTEDLYVALVTIILTAVYDAQ